MTRWAFKSNGAGVVSDGRRSSEADVRSAFPPTPDICGLCCEGQMSRARFHGKGLATRRCKKCNTLLYIFVSPTARRVLVREDMIPAGTTPVQYLRTLTTRADEYPAAALG